MIEANTSYKQNGVPVSIPSGSYGIAPLTVHQYEYPKGHPCITALIPCAPLSRPVCSLNEGTAAAYGTI